MFPAHIQKIISSYYVLGFLPLDKVLHFAVGVLITLLLRWRNIRMPVIFSATIALAIAKEVIDSFVLNNSLSEHVIDILVTIIYPTMVWGILVIQQKHHSK